MFPDDSVGNYTQCRLVWHYLKCIRSDIADTDSLSYIYEGLLQEINEMLCTPVLSGGPMVQKLRAFYCLEVLYHLCLPSTLMSARIPPGDFMPLSVGLPRTWQGLGVLLEVLEEIEKRVVITDAEKDMLGVTPGSTQPNISALLRGKTDTVRQLVGHISKMAKAIRPELKKEDVALATIGIRFADALRLIASPEQRVQHGRNLINISAENGISPCPKPQT